MNNYRDFTRKFNSVNKQFGQLRNTLKYKMANKLNSKQCLKI